MLVDVVLRRVFYLRWPKPQKLGHYVENFDAIMMDASLSFNKISFPEVLRQGKLIDKNEKLSSD
jgi:hypothetical protein